MSEIENQEVVLDLNEQIKQRQQKLKAMRELSEPAFPNDFRRDAYAKDIHDAHDKKEKETLEAEEISVKVAGRIMTRRVMGKASFVTLQDVSGRIQLYLRRDELPEGQYAAFKSWDMGDIIAAEGTLFKTKTGELSVKASQVRILTKALRPLPDKYHGLTDQEMRFRQRYVDLIMSEPTRNLFQLRSQIIDYTRQFLKQHDFLEVETPMMQPIPGGATARPFITHHNTLDMPLYMRIAPELYLKRLVVGGFERVFEINRNFRNEGVSSAHNPEFTMVEFYQAYADFEDMMQLTEVFFKGLANTVIGSESIPYQGETIDFGKPFQRFSMKSAVLHFNPGLSEADLDEPEVMLAELAKHNVKPEKSQQTLAKLLVELFEQTVEGQLIQPTFITDYPTEVSPLSRQNDENPEIVDRFELFIAGREIANGFSELNDPEEQAARFKQQASDKDAGDEEAMFYDADYVRALEYGLPPTAGEGIGIDRLVMLFTDSASIRDVLLFPLLKPEVQK